ncbi:MAG: hypothetical protein KA981_08830 [Bacteroidia bacterium]|nr:hypothetical protein [Bacteroidia bacterium]
MENNIDANSNYYNHLFAQASTDELVISFQEIELQILNVPLKHKPLKFSRVHILLISLPFIIFILFLLFNTDKSQKTPTNSLTIVTSVNKDSIQKADEVSIPVTSKIQPSFIPKQKPMVVKNIRFEPTPKMEDNAGIVYAPFYPQNVTEDELILSYEELAKLHIYTDGCELKYTNLKDSAYSNKQSINLSSVKHYYYTEIHSSGGGYTGNNIGLGNDSILMLLSDSFLPSYPMMIEKIVTNVQTKYDYLKVGDIKTDLLEPKKSLMFSEDYKKLAKDLLVPIRLRLIAKPNIYGKTDQDVVFWFKPNEAFLSKLNLDKANWVKERYSNYSDSIYNLKIEQLRVKRKFSFKLEEPDSLLLDSLINNALVLNSAQLNRLGFRSQANNEIEYDVIYKGCRVSAKPNKTYNVWMFSINKKGGVPFFAPFRKRDLLAHFHGYGSKGKAGLQLLDKTLIQDENSLKHEELLETAKIFKKELPNLIPVKVSRLTNQGTIEYSYFWFLDSLKFREALR